MTSLQPTELSFKYVAVSYLQTNFQIIRLIYISVNVKFDKYRNRARNIKER